MIIEDIKKMEKSSPSIYRDVHGLVQFQSLIIKLRELRINLVHNSYNIILTWIATVIKVKFDNFKISVACKKKYLPASAWICPTCHKTSCSQNSWLTLKLHLDLFGCPASNERCPQFFEADNFIVFLEAIGLSQTSILSVSLKAEDNRSFLARFKNLMNKILLWVLANFIIQWLKFELLSFFLRQFLTTLSETSEWRFFIQNSTIESISIAVDVFICLKKIILPRVSQSIDKQF